MTDVLVPREAASVILLRDGERGPEVWLMRRVVSMAFAAGMYVFPGGKLDADDRETGRFIGKATLARRSAQLGVRMDVAGALVGAAARETFEETGVLLTDQPTVATSEQRQAVESGDYAFSELLSSRGVRVDGQGIIPWARWITPPQEPRRFDTFFFVARMPSGTDPRADTGEAAEAGWVDVNQALDEVNRGARAMLPPTFSNLMDVREHRSVAEVLDVASTRTVAPVHPDLEWPPGGGLRVHLGDGRTVVMTPEAMSRILK